MTGYSVNDVPILGGYKISVEMVREGKKIVWGYFGMNIYNDNFPNIIVAVK